MHRKVAAAIIAALALAVASCGGSETTNLERPELIRRVELACRDAGRASERQSRADSSNPYEAMRAGQKILVARLERLDGSGDTKDAFNAYKDGVRARLDALEKVASAPRSEQPRVLRSVQKDAVVAGRKIGAAVDRLGLKGCG